MTERAALPRLAVLTLCALVGAGRAAALDVTNPMARSTPAGRTTEQFVADLDGDSAPVRRFAGRVLDSRLARADRRRHGDPDSLATMDAQATWDALSRTVPEACVSALRHDEVVVVCSRMLARLGRVDSLPALRDTRLRVGAGRLRRAVERAIVTLERAGPPPPDRDAP
ncbi:MAG: hypothetical protein RLZZ299_2738 [Pseudomonadota bacterium]|jgi:hypothetical protein